MMKKLFRRFNVLFQTFNIFLKSFYALLCYFQRSILIIVLKRFYNLNITSFLKFFDLNADITGSCICYFFYIIKISFAIKVDMIASRNCECNNGSKSLYMLISLYCI